MTEYFAKVGFWLFCTDSVTVDAANELEAFAIVKTAAAKIMESHDHPETIDFDERREGSISYIDRFDSDTRREVAGLVRFDDDRLHTPWHDFIGKIVALPIVAKMDDTAKIEALRQYDALIEEAKSLHDHIA